MKNLIIIPTKLEMELFIKKCRSVGIEQSIVQIGNHEVVELIEIDTGIALGGLGKVQFGVQTQYFIDKTVNLDTVFCVGASGALTGDLSLGDIVVATETVEHDIRKFSHPLIPRFRSNELIVEQFRELAGMKRSYTVHFGAIGSGDEDIMDETRKKEVRDRTNALAVVWEGAGGARACRLSDLPFIEIRGIVDSADNKAEDDFVKNLETVMINLAELITEWASNKKDSY